jgi:protein-L-isoaspartate O-methyltransferase
MTWARRVPARPPGAIAATAGVKSRALVDAFARVPREDFVGPDPSRVD